MPTCVSNRAMGPPLSRLGQFAEYFLGRVDYGIGRTNTTINRTLQEHLANLFRRHSVVGRRAQVQAQLLAAVERRNRR